MFETNFSGHNRIWRAQKSGGNFPGGYTLHCKREGSFWKNVSLNKEQLLPVAFEFVVNITSILAKTILFLQHH